MKRFMSVLLSAAMALTAVPVSVTLSPAVEVDADDEETTEYADATQYTYKITPILESFEYYIYVETDNPNPYSFAFADYDSAYDDETTMYDMPVYALRETHFVDVEYESDDSYRVNGGYIFYCKEGTSDGGELSLLQTVGEAGDVTTVYWGSGGSDDTTYYEYEDTGIVVTAPSMIDYIDYLIDTYTEDGQSFFEKLDAVEAGLSDIAVYPRGVYDSDKPTGYYPALSCSRYAEAMMLNTQYEIIYEEAGGMLLSYAYPFILDSLGYPGTMSAVAKELDSSVEVSDTDLHYMIDVTCDGETRSYGGQGNGGYDPLFSEHVDKLFTFDGMSGDFSSGKSVDEFCSQLMSYDEIAEEDAEYYEDLVAGDTFYETIAATGGTWLRVAFDGTAVGSCTFSYVVPAVMYKHCYLLSDAWVDGRYVGEYECIASATFDEHPTADIVVSDMTYTDAYGDVHTQDVLFEYDEDSGNWIAGWDFTGYASSLGTPDEFILTADDVAAMNLGSEGGSYPESGLIYDGTECPGTEFTNVLVTGIESVEKLEVTVGRNVSLNYSVFPENATYKSISYTPEYGDVAYVQSDFDTGELTVHGVEVGTITVTLTTNDGDYQTLIEVTVKDHMYLDGLIFDMIDENSAVLIGYEGSGMDIVIPSEIEGYQVTEIEDKVFYGNETICNVTISEGITSIGNYVFSGCTSLESVKLPDSLTEIGEGAFDDCNSLKTITIPDDVTEIKENAFFNNFSLETVVLPEGITEIWDSAFYCCDSLKSITIPDSVTRIGEWAFSFCSDLESISLPPQLTNIEILTFQWCDSLTSIWIPATVTNVEKSAFHGCENLMDVYFEGTEEEWNAITVAEYNEPLQSATIHFNSASLEPDLGDINEDGFIDYLDAMIALRYDAELITLTDAQTLAGDVNGDDAVDSLDAILILRYDAGLIESF